VSKYRETLNRKIDTWLECIRVATKALEREKARGITLTTAVKWTAKKYHVSERFLWQYIPTARRLWERIGRSPPRPGRKSSRRPRPLQAARYFLISFLDEGPRRAAEVLEKARAVGISSTTLRRAAKSLDPLTVEIYRSGGRNGYWVWKLSIQAKNISLKDRQNAGY
jgi:hypothetical protein